MDDKKVIQPISYMSPPTDPTPTFDDQEADRFVEDTTVRQYGSFAEWLAANRPMKPEPLPEGIPETDVPEP